MKRKNQLTTKSQKFNIEFNKIKPVIGFNLINITIIILTLQNELNAHWDRLKCQKTRGHFKITKQEFILLVDAVLFATTQFCENE